MSEKAENYLDSIDIEDMVMEIDKDGEFIYASQLMESYYQDQLKKELLSFGRYYEDDVLTDTVKEVVEKYLKSKLK